MRKIFCLCGLLSFTCLVTIAQQPAKAALEKQRAAIQKDLDNAKLLLNETMRNKKASLAQLNAVQQKLELRQKEINVINQQMNIIDADITHGRKDIAKLKQELDTLKLQYDRSTVYSYKTSSNYDLLNFIFSANSFNDAVKRVLYLRSFRAYREEQVLRIVRAQNLLNTKIASLNESKLEKKLVLKDENNTRKELEDEKKEKDAVLNKLKLREKILNKEIANKKQQDIRLSSAIMVAISKAKAADIVADKRNYIAVKKPVGEKEIKSLKEKKIILPTSNSATTGLSKKFEGNLHHLSWPVASGSIAMHFGLQIIPPNNIKIDNKFLTFETKAGEPVKAIFEGEVTMITIVGNVQAVMIRNGDYITTYCNLSSVNVSQGQQIKTGQLLGKVAEKANDAGELELGISNSDNKFFDPEKWLR